jgi:putative transposase
VGTGAPSYKGFRFPVEIISHCVWLYYRFPLSLREVEEMMLARGVTVSHETIRQWTGKFGQAYANRLRRRRAQPGDTWHLDEVFITINGKTHYLWRAVDQDGNVLDILVTSRRDAKAATRFFRTLLTGLAYVPRVLVTDKLGSYQAARRSVLASVEHRQSKYLQQPRGELPPTHSGAGARHEKVQLARWSTTVPGRVQCDISPFPDPSSPAPRSGIPPRDGHPLQYLERRHRVDHHRLNHPSEPDHPTSTTHWIDLLRSSDRTS